MMALRNNDIPLATIQKWQRIVNLTSKLSKVPATLIMKTDFPDHSVLVSSQTEGNPYVEGQSFELNDKLYCNSVLGNCDELIVLDAWNDPEWDDNQDLQHGMSFYIGYPLKWPDGKLFGTICMLDVRENKKAHGQRQLLKEFCQVIETDLVTLEEMARREALQVELNETLATLEQRVKNRTRKLEDANTALRVLIANLETARNEFEARIMQQLKGLISPNIAHLKHCIGDKQPEASYINLLENNLDEITSPYATRMVLLYEKLTPTEIEISQFIMDGQTTKKIAKTLGRQTSTIDFHRNNIRKKLGIDSRKTNLRSYLKSI